MYYSDNPLSDFLKHDAERENWLSKLPRCSQCDEPIQQEDAVRFNDEYICDNCLEDLRVEILQEGWQ